MLAVLNRPGVWVLSGMAGVMTGLSLREAMASLPAGLDRDRCRRFLIVAETAFLTALHRKTKDHENRG